MLVSACELWCGGFCSPLSLGFDFNGDCVPCRF